MLDTNTVSYLVHKRSPKLQMRIDTIGVEERLSISVITEAEMRYGVSLKPEAHRLALAVELILSGLDILPWTSATATSYAKLRAENHRRGLGAGNLDMLIAAHALAENAVLVTSDAALSKLAGGPATVNWADDLRPN
jgi:tRNA(fMet)-specific endonuclease VapC